MTQVGLIGTGDMGHVVGAVLREHGATVRTSLEGRSKRSRDLAAGAGIDDAGSLDALVATSNVLISIVPPAAAAEVAEQVGRAATGSSRARPDGLAAPLYVDANAVAPTTAASIGEVVRAAGCHFVDASIIGPPPRQPGSTRFYASADDGNALAAFETFGDHGLDIRRIDGGDGAASALKMSYAASTKGYAALCTELLLAARAEGVLDVLLDELALSQPDRLAAMERSVPALPVKARRWVGEMEEIATAFADAGLTPRIFNGAADMFRLVGATDLADETPENRDRTRTLRDVIETLHRSISIEGEA